MITFLSVESWFADTEDTDEIYERVTCLACRQLHMLNLRTGKILTWIRTCWAPNSWPPVTVPMPPQPPGECCARRKVPSPFGIRSRTAHTKICFNSFKL